MDGVLESIAPKRRLERLQTRAARRSRRGRLATYHLRCPWRNLNWRWRLANEIFAGGGYALRAVHDEPTRLAICYLRSKWRAKTARRLVYLSKRFPVIHAVLEFSHGDPILRQQVEARILMGQTDDEIASRTGLPADVIATYEALFFGVRDRLHAQDWLRAQVLPLWTDRRHDPLGWRRWLLLTVSAQHPRLIAELVLAAVDRLDLDADMQIDPESPDSLLLAQIRLFVRVLDWQHCPQTDLKKLKIVPSLLRISAFARLPRNSDFAAAVQALFKTTILTSADAPQPHSEAASEDWAA